MLDASMSVMMPIGEYKIRKKTLKFLRIDNN